MKMMEQARYSPLFTFITRKDGEQRFLFYEEMGANREKYIDSVKIRILFGETNRRQQFLFCFLGKCLWKWKQLDVNRKTNILVPSASTDSLPFSIVAIV